MIISEKRLDDCQDKASTDESSEQFRTFFQRDLDKITFSDPFKRLQGKTQVVPFPDSDHIHNRLIHSLEVASIARTLGEECFSKNNPPKFTNRDVGDFISAAALAHDLGNPPFGHAGEKAFCKFFDDHKKDLKEYLDKHNDYSEQNMRDFLSYEGNALGFRILTDSKPRLRKTEGGFGLTYSTLASYLKYPTRSDKCNKDRVSEKKHSFLHTEERYVEKIFRELGIDNKEDGIWKRYPGSFLVEAADDIVYNLHDIEDAFRLKLIKFEEIETNLREIIESTKQYAKKEVDKVDKVDKNEYDRRIEEKSKIAYLRGKVIRGLIGGCISIFDKNWASISNGEFENSLIDELKQENSDLREKLKKTKKLVEKKLFQGIPVTEKELAGFEIINGLLEIFFDALILEKDEYRKKHIKRLLPKYYLFKDKDEKEEFKGYELLLNICEYISGMTDSFAVDLYRKLKGIEISDY